ncbi:probable G-protein coupled receptor 33 [Rhinatrema bivittatum]|uniref:probable G-protein coupled receptor 33 n=1 Tax=Rhinatrema bivittatum TaxID=194408 RepID=UPI0011280D3B|nr:probable G-protein coupled receptor 33 [Rhinatrema bivittatum]
MASYNGTLTFVPVTLLDNGTAHSSSEGSTVVNILQATFLFITFIVGLPGNSLYLWILGWKMKRTVMIIWFSHLIAAYLLFTLTIPFRIVFFLLESHWMFGLVGCKLVSSGMTLSMFSSVFLLMIISVDRCMLVVHPLWSRFYRTTYRASAICVTVWITALCLSVPNLIFTETFVTQEGKTICRNNYAVSEEWKSWEIQYVRRTVHWSMFILILVLGFLFPFSVMTVSYIILSAKIKQKHLTKSGKSTRVIIMAAGSFFVCWLPYHIFHGLLLYQTDIAMLVLHIMSVITVILCCVNACFTPIFYLFIGENFKHVFKKSIHSWFRMAFSENLYSMDSDSEKHLGFPTSHKKMTESFQLSSPV